MIESFKIPFSFGISLVTAWSHEFDIGLDSMNTAGDPLVHLDSVVDWGTFRLTIEKARHKVKKFNADVSDFMWNFAFTWDS